MKMIKSRRRARVAWQNSITTIGDTKLYKRPLTMQIHMFGKRGNKKKKFCGSESPLYIATCPLIYMARIFGLAPYEFDKNQLLVSSNINMIFSAVWLCIYTYDIYFVMQGFTFAAEEEKVLLRITEIGKAGFNYCVLIFDIIVCICTRKQMASIWNEIQDYDEIMYELGFKRSEKNTNIWVWSILLSSTFMWTIISILGMYAFSQSWTDNVTYLILYVGSAAGIVKFVGMVMLLGQRFNHLNEISRKCMSVTPPWVTDNSTVHVATIEYLHNHMLIVADNLNSLYSWSILLWLLNLSLHSVSDLYFVITWILDGGLYWHLINCLLVWTFSFIAQLLLLHCVCDYSATKANCIDFIILGWKRQLYMRNNNMELETSFHMINRQLNFSAAGCFDVNLQLLCSLAGNLTTYLVILLQFD